jgi:hypothetical protein
LTKSVQPYCKLAISTMQMMQVISWAQRVVEAVTAAGWAVVDVLVICFPSLQN